MQSSWLGPSSCPSSLSPLLLCDVPVIRLLHPLLRTLECIQEAFGPLAVLLVGFLKEDYEGFQKLMQEMEADMVKVGSGGGRGKGGGKCGVRNLGGAKLGASKLGDQGGHGRGSESG